jgi:aspartate ammonia-lyase
MLHCDTTKVLVMKNPSPNHKTRTEHDLLGERQIPADAYWGVHTLRALENFPISGIKLSAYPELVKSLAWVKAAAAQANCELRVLSEAKAKAILAACAELVADCEQRCAEPFLLSSRGPNLCDQFVIDVIQGGAGTSTNMNANEVIANRALEILGAQKGEYGVLHPIEDVNASQSTNDVYPTALRVASCLAIEKLLEAMAFVQLSGVLKRIACKVSKVCNDLRLLSSGPQAGFQEINLPERAAGSSIMPGKVNPIIPEVVNQIAFEVIGNDMTVTMASEGGQLQLNAFEPIIAWSLFKSIDHLRAGCQTLARHCVVGITANRELLAERVRRSAGLATALNPYIGYENATRIAREAMLGHKTVAELVLEQNLLTSQ